MASSSNYTTANGSSKTSRFSTLKVFKFNKGADNLKPPPPPPKDYYYLNNRSLASLSPDSFSQSVPNSPLSPQMAYYQNNFARGPSPSPPQNYNYNTNSSSMSLSSSGGDPSPGSQPASLGKTKGSGFFRFAKRSPRSPSIKSPNHPDSPISGDDENISMPTNFQVCLITLVV
jgi:p21-activated kinase 1